MRTVTGILGIVTLLLTVTSQPARGGRSRATPVHPDTLPTLLQSWQLPASLAPSITNTYAPRMSTDGKLLYVFDHHGRRMVAVNPVSGRVKWHVPVPSRSDRAFSVTPLVAEGKVYVANDGHAYAFETKRGKEKWRVGLKGVAINSLALSKHFVLVPWLAVNGAQAQPGVHLWAVNNHRGQVEWSKKFSGQLAYVLGDEEGFYFVNDRGLVIGLTADRGDPRWQGRLKGKITGQPLLHQGVLYLTSLRKKAGWSGAEIVALNGKTGKVLWQKRFPTPKLTAFIAQNKLIVVEGTGRLTQLSAKGEQEYQLELGFSEPSSLVGGAVGDRAFVFTYEPDGQGYIRLIDLEKKKMLAAANALDMDVRTMIPAAKALLLDARDGQVHAFRMDKSQRPKRAVVPPEEFAQEMLQRARKTPAAIEGLADRLAGLGVKALPPIEAAMESDNPRVAEAAATAVGYLGSKRSVPALLKALTQQASKPHEKTDPVVSLINALAELKDGRAVTLLQKIMKDEGQDHHRRRAAYVGLGAIGSPVSLAPIWAFRGVFQVPSTRWSPQAFTPAYRYKVEEDIEEGPEDWSEKIRRATAITVQEKAGQIYSAALSPYLGGYNDIWVGKSDLSGIILEPFFSGLTKAEVVPNRRIRFKKLRINDGWIELIIESRMNRRWVESKPLKLFLRTLARDKDRDKLPDIVERRLRLCVYDADCDGDGLKDGEDLNPLASGKLSPTVEQQLFREAFFTFYAFLKRRGVVVVDPGEGASFELYGRKDPILSLRRKTIEKFRKEAGLHAVDVVSFGGPYPEGSGSGDALPQVVWNKKKTEVTIGLDIFRSAENAVAFNVTLKKAGKNWIVTRFFRVWATD